jgi:hypothetical protein
MGKMKYSIHKGDERYEKNFDEIYLLDINGGGKNNGKYYMLWTILSRENR